MDEPVCKKVCYYDELSAKIALADTQLRPSIRREENRIYYCVQHHAWHLTKKRTDDGTWVDTPVGLGAQAKRRLPQDPPQDAPGESRGDRPPA